MRKKGSEREEVVKRATSARKRKRDVREKGEGSSDEALYQQRPWDRPLPRDATCQ